MILLRISLLAVLLGIAYLSLTPSTSVSVGNDKLGHFIAYGALMFNLGIITVKNQKQLIAAALFALSYGALMEWGQSFVPGRTVSAYDMLANACGVGIGLIVTVLIGRRVRELFEIGNK